MNIQSTVMLYYFNRKGEKIMSSTNKTPHLGLSQFIATDVPSWLGDINDDMSNIDTGVFEAKETASSALNAIQLQGSQITDIQSNLNSILEDVSQDKVAIQGLQSQVNVINDGFKQTSSQLKATLPTGNADGYFPYASGGVLNWDATILVNQFLKFNMVSIYGAFQITETQYKINSSAGSALRGVSIAQLTIPELPAAVGTTREIFLSGFASLQEGTIVYTGVPALRHLSTMAENEYLLVILTDNITFSDNSAMTVIGRVSGIVPYPAQTMQTIAISE